MIDWQWHQMNTLLFLKHLATSASGDLHLSAPPCLFVFFSFFLFVCQSCCTPLFIWKSPPNRDGKGGASEAKIIGSKSWAERSTTQPQAASWASQLHRTRGYLKICILHCICLPGVWVYHWLYISHLIQANLVSGDLWSTQQIDQPTRTFFTQWPVQLCLF